MRLVYLAAALMTFSVTAAHSQQFCADRNIIVERLQSGYSEQYHGGGLRNGNSVFEIWKSDEKGTWTILKTMADGRSCVMASGTDWRDGEVVALGIDG